jgi:hypothetical protein
MKIRSCWLCCRKLRGDKFERLEIDGHERTLHKACAKYAREELAKEAAQKVRLYL